MTVAPLSPLYLLAVLGRAHPAASQSQLASIVNATRARLSLTQILLCFLGSGLFILIGTLIINCFQKKQRPHK